MYTTKPQIDSKVNKEIVTEMQARFLIEKQKQKTNISYMGGKGI